MSKNFELLKQLDTEWINPAAESRRASDEVHPLSPSSIKGRTYEALNKLVQRIFLASSESKRSVLFAGAAPGVGCTWVAARAAQVLSSQTTVGVCLVEAGELPSWLLRDLDETSKLAVAAGGPNVRLKLAENLWIFPLKETPSADQRFRYNWADRIRELQGDFEYVLVDAPPVSASSRCLSLGPLTEGAVLVLKAGSTSRPAVQSAIRELENTGIKLLGTVLNQREYPIPAAIYRRL